MTNHDDQIRSLLCDLRTVAEHQRRRARRVLLHPDGIFMPTTLPTAEGADMQGAYRQIFDAIRLDVTFTIDELEVTSDDSAYALDPQQRHPDRARHRRPDRRIEPGDLPVPPHRRRLEDRPLHVQQAGMNGTDLESPPR